MSQRLAKQNAWGIERIALEDTKERDLKWAGVVVRQGKHKLVWLTAVDDFWGEHSFTNPENILQRCLPLNRFRLTPAMNREVIEAAIRLR